MTDLTDTLTPLAARIAALQAEIDERTQELDILKATIRDIVSGPDTYDAGGVQVVVSTNNRFDTKKALTLIPDTLRPLVIEHVETVNKDKLKALAPDVYEQSLTVGAYRVGIR
jgi:hypothetical protein